MLLAGTRQTFTAGRATAGVVGIFVAKNCFGAVGVQMRCYRPVASNVTVTTQSALGATTITVPDSSLFKVGMGLTDNVGAFQAAPNNVVATVPTPTTITVNGALAAALTVGAVITTNQDTTATLSFAAAQLFADSSAPGDAPTAVTVVGSPTVNAIPTLTASGTGVNAGTVVLLKPGGTTYMFGPENTFILPSIAVTVTCAVAGFYGSIDMVPIFVSEHASFAASSSLSI
jgi:hypothetical protein